MQEELLGYLLDALEPADRQRIEDRLRDDPQLQLDLETLHERLEPLRVGDVEYEPPAGLGERTCSLVASHAAARLEPSARHAASGGASPGEGALSPALRAAPASGGWTLTDLTVAAGIFLAAALLLFPALQQSRIAARIAGCQNNLRQLGMALARYSETHDGFFPAIPTDGNRSVAGYYAVSLKDGGFIDSTRWLLCPGSPQAVNPDLVYVPTAEELDRVKDGALAHWQRYMGGSFGYTIGYQKDGRYQPVRNRGRSTFAIMADAPDVAARGIGSANHGGSGQNVLYEDGHVAHLSECHAEGCLDNIYLNEDGLVAAGRHENDAVIGRSSARPLIFEVRP